MGIQSIKIFGIDEEGNQHELLNRNQAATVYGCNPTRITALAKKGNLTTLSLSGGNSKQNFYIKDEVESLSRSNSWLREQVMEGKKRAKTAIS